MIDLSTFKTLVKKQLNIDLFLYKEEQLNRRLNSFFLRNGITDVNEYVNLITRDRTEKEKFLDFVTINVTEFYRNPELYRELASVLKTRGNRPYKIWSAACSCGCEPYSLAILLNELGYTNYTIYATDLDPNIIKRAQEGIYDEIEIKSLPLDLLKKYFTQVDRRYQINSSLKKNVIFKNHDLLMDKYDTDFDLVLCRNVVIYFNTEAKDKLYRNISKSIKKDGLFFVGATENIHDCDKYGLEKLTSFIYRKK